MIRFFTQHCAKRSGDGSEPSLPGVHDHAGDGVRFARGKHHIRDSEVCHNAPSMEISVEAEAIVLVQELFLLLLC